MFTYLGHYFAQEKEGGQFLDAPKAIKCYRTALKSNPLNKEAGWGLSELLLCAEGVCCVRAYVCLCVGCDYVDDYCCLDDVSEVDDMSHYQPNMTSFSVHDRDLKCRGLKY